MVTPLVTIGHAPDHDRPRPWSRSAMPLVTIGHGWSERTNRVGPQETGASRPPGSPADLAGHACAICQIALVKPQVAGQTASRWSNRKSLVKPQVLRKKRLWHHKSFGGRGYGATSPSEAGPAEPAGHALRRASGRRSGADALAPAPARPANGRSLRRENRKSLVKPQVVGQTASRWSNRKSLVKPGGP